MSRSRLIHVQLSGIVVSTSRVGAEVDDIELDLFFDYDCPFVYRAAKMLEAVGGSGKRAVRINWRFFSLSQVNHRKDGPNDSWAVWKAPSSEPVKGRLAFKAAEAASRQGRFDAFHQALL